ncbi:MAG: Phosphoribosylaminoimidazole (AIR) synthetase [Candidatus Moranbacteria bacterium GW2011_GWE1_49_15]|nr:MAG: Phosphoribosylaminoimidazole (AIR) synthetase [Candidatus Moranbacteria bacterium GW2011_GWE1_49_15]HBP00938.1 phosphoribosylformylglycinamidine cyclo-ligase [Candidatus Moranbacteria bacterium]
MSEQLEQGMTYAGTGINYKEMDPFKRKALGRALRTRRNLERLGFKVVEESYGESAIVIDVGPFYLVVVEEGLGTKNLVAEAMEEISGEACHGLVAQCNFAMASNDLSTVGATPFLAMLHLAVGNAKWLADKERTDALVDGYGDACDEAGCTWGGGETPTLRDIVNPSSAVFANCCIGAIMDKDNLLLGSRIEHGDAIILVESSGIHANGLTLARDIRAKLPEGYAAKLPSGRKYGEVLLDPTIIYAPLVDACAHLLHYAVNITGHGWRKLMRAKQNFTYVVEKLPEVPEIFRFMQEHGPVDDREAYGNLNMGAGFALYASPRHADEIVQIAQGLGLKALTAGYVFESERRQVVIGPLDNLTYDEEELKVR